MYLSRRSDTLLRDLLIHPRRTSKELQSTYDLSRRQVDYSISKLNYWLKEKSYPCIQHTSSGYFVASPTLLKLMSNLDGESKVHDWYVSSQKERGYVIILMIITRDEPLSVNHFISELGVSRNTVLRDLKEAANILKPFQLKTIYSRKQGYQIIGEEWDKRFILIKVINYLIKMNSGETCLQHFLGISQAHVDHWRRKLEQVESQLKFEFTGKRMQVFPYLLESLFKRIDQGKTIKNIFLVDYKGLSDTREYSAVELLIKDQENVSAQERMYITLQVLTSNIIPSKDFMFDKIPQMERSLKECLSLFEKNACVTLKDKPSLLNKLMIHFKPAYYRIKYRLTFDYSGLNQIGQEYKLINYFVKQSIDPLEKLIGAPIPDDEILFISLFIACHLINFGSQFNSRLKAAVVCTNGVSISLLMERTLKGLFSDMIFYKAMSIREFKQFQYPCDVVFSAVPIETKAKLFVVNEVMNEKEKARLKDRILKEIYHFDPKSIDVEEMMAIIEKSADIREKDKLQSALADFVTRKATNVSQNDESTSQKTFCQIYDLLPMPMIQQITQVNSWDHALEISAKPLLNRGIISETYLQQIRFLYKKPLPQIILGTTIALPHAEPKYGVHKLGMSLLHIRNGLKITESQTIYFVVVLAPVDKKAHFNALLELTSISKSKTDIERMKQAKSCKELFSLIKIFGDQEAKKIM